MLVFLAIPVLLGYLCSRRLLGRDEPVALAGESLGLALVLSLLGVNGFYRLFGSQVVAERTGLEWSTGLTVLLELLLTCGLAWKATSAKPLRKLEPRWLYGILLGLSTLILLYTNAQQIGVSDDDYWIHAPLQGLMRAGNFPPYNPFFSDIAMNGHYGRNLGIAAFSTLTGMDVFLSQHLLTSGIQVVTFWLFFAAFTRSAASPSIGLLAAGFVYFGINVGGRGGLIDTVQNNNAFVHLYLALLLGLVIDVWQRGSRSATLLAGLSLGGYAIVYETHYGLVFLTVAVLTPLLAARRLIGPRAALCALLVLLISLPLALTQGGPLADLWERKRQSDEHSQLENLSKGMQNQAQLVKITFPKKELFQILLETGEYQRVAHVYTLDTPLRRLHTPTTERGYAYIWSWSVLKIHFLPLYLFPLCLAVLWRRGSLAGHFMGGFGVISFLTPALVNFGPIYESEYYRWEFAAGLGFAGCLGLTFGHLAGLDRAPTEPLVRRSWRYLKLSRGGTALLGLGLLTVINSWASLSFVKGRLSESLGKDPSHWLYFPSTQKWLGRHQLLDFDELDFQAARWLSAQVSPGDRLLTNFRQENNFSILFESTLTGMTGARCVGHALPREEEKIGTTPFRQSPPAVAFWQTYRPDCLAQLGVKWLYYRDDHGRDLPSVPGVTVVHREQEGSRRRIICQVDPQLLPKLQASGQTSGGTLGRAELTGFPVTLREGRLVELVLSSDRPSQGVLELSTVRRADGLNSLEQENLKWRLELDGQPLRVPFVAPYDPGVYELKARWLADSGQPELEIASSEIEVNFLRSLEQAKLVGFRLPHSQALDKTWPTRALLRPSVRLLPSGNPWPESDDVLACWAFYSPERKEFDLPPQVHMRRVHLGQQSLGLPLVTPSRPGLYRLALYVSPEQGQLFRFSAGSVTIGQAATSTAEQAP